MRGSWRAARRLGGGRAGPSRRRLPTVFLSLLAVSPATSTPSPRLLHVSLTITLHQTVSTRSSCVIRCLPKHVAHVPKCTRLPLRFSLSGQRSYAYVMRAEEGEPGNEAIPTYHKSSTRKLTGWKEFAGNVKRLANFWHRIWSEAGCPSGVLFQIKKHTKSRYKHEVRRLKRKQNRLLQEKLAGLSRRSKTFGLRFAS